jgi:predicted GNAT family N-acyltransferase
MDVISIKVLPFNSTSQLKSIELRNEILRKPLGLAFTKEELESESNQYHLAAVSDENIVGILLLNPMENQIVKMRQVAVSLSYQNRGIGKQMVLYSEEFALEKGFKKMILNARLTAVPFYMMLGYKCSGNQFEEVGIPHYFMYKQLR